MANKTLNLKELKDLVFNQNQATKENKNTLFKLAKACEDLKTIKKLADDFEYKNAIEYLNEYLKNDLYTQLYLYDQSKKELQKAIHEIQNMFLEEYAHLTLNTLSQNDEYNKSIKEIEEVYTKDLNYAINNIDEDEFDYVMENIIKENNLHYIKYLVENSFEVNRKFYDDTLLSYIINSYDNISEPIEIVEYLISKSADVTIQTKNYDEEENITGHTSLLESAILNNYTNIAKLLIKNKAHLLVKDSSLFYAVSGSHYEMVELLLKDIDLEKIHNKGFSQLITAIEHDDIKMVKILLDYNVNISMYYIKHGFTALMIAVANNKNILIEKIKNDDTLKLATKEASINNLKKQKFDHHNDIAKLLIEKGANIDAKDNYGVTAFDMARELKNYNIMKLLLIKSNSINFNTKMDTKIHLQYSNYSLSDGKRYYQQRYFDNFISTENSKNIEELKQCIKEGGDATRINLIEKIKNNFDSDYIQFAIDNGAKINVLDNNQMSALHHAVKLNKIDIAKILLKNSIDILCKNKYGETALDMAINKDVILLLLEYEERENKFNTISLILQKFSNDDKLRFTNHPWSYNDFNNGQKLTYDNFMKNVKEGWDEIKYDLEKLSKNLYDKIEKFLFDENTIGFSNPKIKKQLQQGKKPHEIKLDNNQTFQDKMDDFKGVFVIKQNDKNIKLLKKFTKLKKELDLSVKLNLNDLKEANIDKFFTDVEKFELALKTILKDINENANEDKKDIIVTAEEPRNKNYVEIKLIHQYSNSSKTADALKETINKNGGNFKTIYDNLKNLCDWSIDTVCQDGKRYKIDYLYPEIDNNAPHITPIDETIEGFTHILRFKK